MSQKIPCFAAEGDDDVDADEQHEYDCREGVEQDFPDVEERLHVAKVGGRWVAGKDRAETYDLQLTTYDCLQLLRQQKFPLLTVAGVWHVERSAEVALKVFCGFVFF